jgi:hypothetical protein
MSEQTPSVGRIVHYRSHGTPLREDGTRAYEMECRAAIVTATHGPDASGEVVSLAVFNPEGMFFSQRLPQGDVASDFGGTWHWPERV